MKLHKSYAISTRFHSDLDDETGMMGALGYVPLYYRARATRDVDTWAVERQCDLLEVAVGFHQTHTYSNLSSKDNRELLNLGRCL